MSQTRRAVLKGLTVALASIPFAGNILPNIFRRDKTSYPKYDEAVGLMQLINTVEARHYRESGLYVEPWELNRIPVGQMLLAMRAAPVSFDPTLRRVGGFQAFWNLSPDASNYEVSLVDVDTGFAVVSDTIGEIFYGDTRQTGDGHSGTSLRKQLAFSGSSIGPGHSLFSGVAEFMAPTLYAVNCCSGSSCLCVPTAPECPSGSTACNVGTGGNCNWCCQANSNCSTCVPLGCTGGGS